MVMRVLVLQSDKPPPRAAWRAQCLASVRSWAAAQGYDYRFLGDELFEPIPEDVRRACQGVVLPLTDIGRLLWLQKYWSPESQVLLKDIALFQGSFSEQLQYRLDGGSMAGENNDASDLLGVGQLIDFFGRSLGMMMLGMAAFKTGVLTKTFSLMDFN